ncbi:MAG TPA: DNA replication/repair protein RecF [Gammaproteobacteria bacterium]|nr:DNA replication/repair protein RecF [Gammaproteobacteria bacterium]HAU06705.1 DNA replication/repair protein RecF [Gammaproteobacteria bacterium]
MKQLRNITAISMELDAKTNFIVGDNGAGKSTILEAIHMLALGRSFKTRQLKQTVQFEQQYCQIVAKSYQQQIPIGLQYDLSDGLSIRLNNAPLSRLSALAQHLPLQLIPANSHQFFEQGPKYRRQLIDWGLFHVEPDYNFHWQHYRKALQQRNRSLKQKLSVEYITIWHPPLIEHGEIIDRQRKKRLTELLAVFQQIFPQLCPELANVDWTVKYQSGWLKNHSFTEVLEQGISRDQQLSYTKHGCHNADWSFLINGHDPAILLSRGQQKLFFIAICLCQIKTTPNNLGNSLLLIDDLAAELDVAHQQTILQVLNEFAVQSFIAMTSEIMAKRLQTAIKGSTFHVKQGEIVS